VVQSRELLDLELDIPGDPVIQISHMRQVVAVVLVAMVLAEHKQIVQTQGLWVAQVESD
jgi:hypothetical protein